MKCVCDGLNGLAYIDDSQVDQITVERVCDGEKWTRVRITYLIPSE